jgi:hypothetical protein
VRIGQGRHQARPPPSRHPSGDRARLERLRDEGEHDQRRHQGHRGVESEQQEEPGLDDDSGERGGDRRTEVERPELEVEAARPRLLRHHVDRRRDDGRAGHRVEHAQQSRQHDNHPQWTSKAEREHQDRGRAVGRQQRGPAAPHVGQHTAQQASPGAADAVCRGDESGQGQRQPQILLQVQRQEQHREGADAVDEHRRPQRPEDPGQAARGLRPYRPDAHDTPASCNCGTG